MTAIGDLDLGHRPSYIRRRALRERLAYQRRRMPHVARCRVRGEPLQISCTDEQGTPYVISGLVRSDVCHDWVPVLPCDVSVPKTGALRIVDPRSRPGSFTDLDGLTVISCDFAKEPPATVLTFWEASDDHN